MSNTEMTREQIKEEIRNLDQLMKANDYIGTKIAMGRATKEEYAEEIAKSEEWAQRKNELQAMLDEMNEAGMLKEGQKILLATFGAGFTWASMIIET